MKPCKECFTLMCMDEKALLTPEVFNKAIEHMESIKENVDGNPNLPEMIYDRFYAKGRLLVLHRETCPECKRNLVNLYKSDELQRYLCRECLEKLNLYKSEVDSE